ncbi:MAG: PHP domain-containing protein [Candidatus Levybacteria bacterium]|nr:PHP domain-containing protein [Candidatus Levybacteria bacterium]
MSNREIAKLFKDVAAAYVIKNEEKFRFQILAYQKASDAVSNLTSELQDFYKENKLELVPGIGKTITSHLIELFKSGKVKHFEWVLKGIPASVFVLIDIPSFGPKKAYKLIKEFKLNNPDTVINDLVEIARAGKIAKLEGFGEKSQEDIIRALSEYKQGEGKTTRMVLPYAYEVSEKIVSYLKGLKYVKEAIVLGSIRRMTATVGDIDIAVATNHPKETIEHFTSYPHKERLVEKGIATASILISGDVQVDLMTQPPESFGSLLQHFTGSKNHNVHLREYALRKGLSLSEYGIRSLTKKNQPLSKYDNEEKFYNALGLDWIPPEIRENTGEIELAAQHKLPQLVELKNMKGDLHTHSNFSIEPSHDLGHNSIEDMAETAVKLGYEYIGLSEHNPSVSKHSQNDIHTLIKRRDDYIEQIKSEMKNVRILKLLEIDILVNGGLAINDKCLDLLDGAIVSIHSSFNMNKEDMTKRVLEGLSHPKAKILAHPTGRMIGTRQGYDLDFQKIFEFCRKHNKALEINAWPNRLDLTDTIARQAIENKVKLAINTDSHASSQMILMKYGVAMARRGWATKNDIINTLSYSEFAEWLKAG